MSPLLLRRLPDEKLGSRLASGEAAAFDELYRRYRHRLAAYAAQLLGDAAAGDDVAQSTLMRTYQVLRKGDCPQRLRPWLYSVAHNLAIDQLRGRREAPTGFSRPLFVQPDEGSGTLIAAIASLPERQRQAYVLRELHGLRVDEIAHEFALERSQIEQSLFAARNRLAELLVFGERLDCVAVRRLALGPIDASERQGLKTHLRSCPGCRKELGRRGIALSLLPVPSLAWLRSLGGGPLAAGGPTAAKVGTAICVAGVVGAVPLTIGSSSGGSLHAARLPARQHPRPVEPAVRHRPVLRAVPAARPAPLVGLVAGATLQPHPRDRRVAEVAAPRLRVAPVPAPPRDPGSDDLLQAPAISTPEQSPPLQPATGESTGGSSDGSSDPQSPAEGSNEPSGASEGGDGGSTTISSGESSDSDDVLASTGDGGDSAPTSASSDGGSGDSGSAGSTTLAVSPSSGSLSGAASGGSDGSADGGGGDGATSQH